MVQNNKIATVFGGTGFIGRHIVRSLARRGIVVKVATRVPERAYFLKPSGAVGQIVPVVCDYSNAQSVLEAVAGADYVVNCIGILYERGKRSTFQRAHVDVPALIARSCADADVSRFVHISALACDLGVSKYAKSKYAGEKAVLGNFPRATILRPSVVFGEGDNFFNLFAELSRYMPFLPLIGGGITRFQPVFVADVAECAVAALVAPSDQYCGQVYHLGGPDVVNFKQIYQLIFKYTGRKRKLVSVPYNVAKMEASLLSLLPKPLLTRDQVESLKTDNVVRNNAQGMSAFGIVPKSLDLVLPSYLSRYKKGGGRFDEAHAAAS